MSNKLNNTTEELTMKDDVIFKAFFSKKGNKKFLKSFLESILKESLEIKKIAEQIEPLEDYSKIRRAIVIATLDYSIVDLPEYFIKQKG